MKPWAIGLIVFLIVGIIVTLLVYFLVFNKTTKITDNSGVPGSPGVEVSGSTHEALTNSGDPREQYSLNITITSPANMGKPLLDTYNLQVVDKNDTNVLSDGTLSIVASTPGQMPPTGMMSVPDSCNNNIFTNGGQTCTINIAGTKMETLTDGETYTVKIQSKNIKGTSDWVNSSPILFDGTKLQTLASSGSASGVFEFYGWEAGDWAPCDTQTLTQTRTVECKNSEGQVVNELNCQASEKPDPTRTCINPYNWKSGDWSNCDSSNTQTRSVTCVDQNNNTVADSNCTDTKPSTQIECQLGCCYTAPKDSTDPQSNIQQGSLFTSYVCLGNSSYPTDTWMHAGKDINKPQVKWTSDTCPYTAGYPVYDNQGNCLNPPEC